MRICVPLVNSPPDQRCLRFEDQHVNQAKFDHQPIGLPFGTIQMLVALSPRRWNLSVKCPVKLSGSARWGDLVSRFSGLGHRFETTQSPDRYYILLHTQA